MIICLGIFLIPKDNFYAQASHENCCKKDTSAKSCCEKSHNSPKKENQKSSCNDDCCTSCTACTLYIDNIADTFVYAEHSGFASNPNLSFQYSDPYFSDRLRDIWQPPKLG
nr:hypothetical protein [uncultured Chryseobacterium sp.]